MIRIRLFLLMFALTTSLSAQVNTVRGKVDVLHHSRIESGSSDVVVWLTPIEPSGPVSPGPPVHLAQKNKEFIPHVLAITVGTQVDFPNQDPFFHDVFSIYRGKPFDVGLYEKGTVRSVRFTQPGVSYIFCNIHPDMSGVIVALTTPFFAITAHDGDFQMSHVPSGSYKLNVWYEFASEAELTSASRNLTISSGVVALPAITLYSSDAIRKHLNKYGEQYSIDKETSY
jgi:hypothetical protein